MAAGTPSLARALNLLDEEEGEQRAGARGTTTPGASEGAGSGGASSSGSEGDEAADDVSTDRCVRAGLWVGRPWDDGNRRTD